MSSELSTRLSVFCTLVVGADDPVIHNKLSVVVFGTQLVPVKLKGFLPAIDSPCPTIENILELTEGPCCRRNGSDDDWAGAGHETDRCKPSEVTVRSAFKSIVRPSCSCKAYRAVHSSEIFIHSYYSI